MATRKYGTAQVSSCTPPNAF